MIRFFALLVTVFSLSFFVPLDAEAKRLGGGKDLGKQSSFSRQSTTPNQPTNTTRQTNNQANNQTPANQPSGLSRWMGPLAGLAAGGLLAAMFFGGGFEGLQVMDFLMFGLLILGGVLLFRMLRKRSAPMARTTTGHSMPYSAPPASNDGGRPGSLASTMGGFSGSSHPQQEAPAWFDGQTFAEGAKSHFIRMQAAWDQNDMRDIRDYTTPELFAELQLERQRLGEATHYTEVVELHSELAGVMRDGDQVLAAVRFTGLVREDSAAAPTSIDETWNVLHPWETAAGDWRVAGIQQNAE